MTDLIVQRVDKARLLLLEARDARQAKKVADMAKAAEVYAKRQKLSAETISYATTIKVDAKALMGKFLKMAEKNKGRPGPGRGKPSNKREPGFSEPPTLTEAGITKRESSESQKLARLQEEDQELFDRVRNGKTGERVAFKALKKKDREQERASAAASAGDVLDQIHVGDFVKLADLIPDGSLSLILTDPPYNKESLGLFDDLGVFAYRKLALGGSLITYCGQTQLPYAIASLSDKLRYWWTLCNLHADGANQMREYGIKNHWKPILWFVKGTRHDPETFVNDVISGGKEKSHHQWQQAESEAAYLIEKLTPEGGSVCDPCLGGGTVAVAAKKLGRPWVAFGINMDSAALASKRIAEA